MFLRCIFLLVILSMVCAAPFALGQPARHADLSHTADTLNDEMNQDDNARKADVKAMKQLILNMLAQEDPPSPPIGTIYGAMNVPIERTNTKEITKTIAEGTTVKTTVITTEKEKSPLQGIEIMLCNQRCKKDVRGAIEGYAKKTGFDMQTFGTEWPGIREQAEELMGAMAVAAVEDKVMPIVETNDAGEYQIKNIPKGKYYLYVQFLTNRRGMYWMIPLVISDKKPVSQNILQDNLEMVLWEGPSAPNKQQ